ncbi:MAG: cell division protein FtsQ/DivIB [Legionellaceae bacterium]|nr:cell division protein FtsQ/DivIB [Legionellaceae bacterium]
MGDSFRKFSYNGFLSLLIVCAFLLIIRVVYLYAATPQRFPVNTFKISASYQHISRKQIQDVLANYSNDSFISMPVNSLKEDLLKLNWAQEINIKRVWPDTLKITIVEKVPVAFWKNSFLTINGQLIPADAKDIQVQNQIKFLPNLKGPAEHQQEVLQNYQKLSKLLESYGLRAVSLKLRDNHSWDIGLSDGVVLRLGKRDLDKRVLRFCKAYSAVFADKSEQLASVDLRYPHGMAVQWNGSTNK